MYKVDSVVSLILSLSATHNEHIYYTMLKWSALVYIRTDYDWHYSYSKLLYRNVI